MSLVISWPLKRPASKLKNLALVIHRDFSAKNSEEQFILLTGYLLAALSDFTANRRTKRLKARMLFAKKTKKPEVWFFWPASFLISCWRLLSLVLFTPFPASPPKPTK